MVEIRTDRRTETASDIMGPLARTIYTNKYAMAVNGRKETWAETADRVASCVMGPYLPEFVPRVRKLIRQRKFMPGGRYLATAGREFPQITNCALFSVEDSREGWADLVHKCMSALMTGAGVGVTYGKVRPENAMIKKMGGQSTGPVALMQIVNDAGRYIMQGGSRRSAIWAGLPWYHPDIFRFIKLKDWHPLVRQGKKEDFNFPGTMDGTNISVILDDDFFAAYTDSSWKKEYRWERFTYTATSEVARRVYWQSVRGMLETGEPGFSIDVGEKNGENLRNAPVHGDTKVLTSDGYRRVADIVDSEATVWTGKQWAHNVVFRKTGEMVQTVKVTLTGGREIVCDPSHPFLVEYYKGAGKRRQLESTERVPASELEEGDIISVSLPQPDIGPLDRQAYTLGFVYGDGSFISRQSAEVTICDESKLPCAEQFDSGLISSSSKTPMGYVRYYMRSHPIFGRRSKDVAPSPMSPTWTASFLAGLFDTDGNILHSQNRIRLSSVRREFLDGVCRMLESIGILAHVSTGGPSGYGGKQSWQLVVAADYVHRFLEVVPTVRVRFDPKDWTPYRKSTVKVISVVPDKPADVYCCDVKMEEHSFMAEGVLVSNCTEITSRDDGDVCNLGSLNMSRFESVDEFTEAVEAATAFLLCGTIYGKLPLPLMYEVREKNRRLGLGLMGMHEWLLQRGKRYGPDDELEHWMRYYSLSGGIAAQLADRLGVSRPVATRSIAPTGTIAIVAETTSGIEPIFAVAYKRRYLDGTTWKAQYVIDSTAKRLIDRGVDPDLIEDAVTLAEDPSRRLAFQAWAQSRVDHAISSTLNLPEWGSSINNEDTVESFGKTLMTHLPRLRGVTAYPNGARDGQPLVRMAYKDVAGFTGVEFIDGAEEGCRSGVCGI